MNNRSTFDSRYEQGFMRGFFYKNPVLVRVIGIGPAVAAAYSLQNGTALCIIMLILFISTGVFTFFAGGLLSEKAAVPAEVVFSSLMLIPAFLLCEALLPGTVEALGVFAPLMMVNTLIISRSDSYTGRSSLGEVIKDVLGNAAGFCAVVLFVSAVRELISFGTLFGLSAFGITPVENFRLPFAGYVILGLLAALLRNVRRKVRDNREERLING